MKKGHNCEHMKELGACSKCSYPLAPRPAKFVAGKKDWLLLYKDNILQQGRTLSDLLIMVKGVVGRTEKNFMINCPNGVGLSLGVARELGV